jgi:hypothetical protein
MVVDHAVSGPRGTTDAPFNRRDVFGSFVPEMV